MDTGYNVLVCIFVFFSAGTQQVLVINKEQQECKSSLGHLHIKEEREELWSSQAGQFLEGSEKSALPVVLVEGESQEEPRLE